MAEVTEGSVALITSQKTMEKDVDGTANHALSIINDSLKSEVIDTSCGSATGDREVSDTNIIRDGEVQKEKNSDLDLLNDSEDFRGTLVKNEQLSESMKVEEDDHDFLSEDFMDNLDVVDSWVDTTDNVGSPSNELDATTNSLITSQATDMHVDPTEEADSEEHSTNVAAVVHVDSKPTKEDIEKHNTSEAVDVHVDSTGTKDVVKAASEKHSSPTPTNKADKTNSEKHSTNIDQIKSNDNDIKKKCRLSSEDKKATEKGKKTVDKESNDKNRNRNSDRTDKREHDNRRERSPNRSTKSTDVSRRNTDRPVDRGNTSVSSRTRRNSRTRRSRTRSRERDLHYNSRKNQRELNSQRRGDSEHRTSRTTSLHQKRDRSPDRDKRSVKRQSSTGKEVTKTSTASTGKAADANLLMFKKIPPSLDALIPPGTEDDVLTNVDDKLTAQFLSADALVPPGTVEVLLPDVIDQSSSSSKKRKASNPDLNKSKLKSGTEMENSQNDKDKRGGTEKKRRITSTGTDDTLRRKQLLDTKKGELSGRERIARDQDRISRELSLERLRESRNRDRDRYPNRDRHGQSYRSRDERDRRSGSFERRASHDSRWEVSGRERYERRIGELSPVSPGRMSRGSPMSFEFSPVSSRSSSRERLKLEYQRGKFRSYSPISSGSNLSRSMVSISSDEERDPRSSRRRRRLPFLDEMERKLGLKLTGGHNINQQLLASRPKQFSTAFNSGIDVSAPPPGTYPVSYPPMVSYATPFPQAVNPMYPIPAPTFIPVPPVATKPPVVRATGPSPVVAPSNSAPSSQRNLVRLPRDLPVNITYKFQRPAQNEEPPTMLGGVATGEMSLSSLLEASVKGTLEATKTSEVQQSAEVGGGNKNPLDDARLRRCQVAVQTLQDDESFSMITMGRFIVQPSPCKNASSSYSLVARFDHPAQESMFKLKSPLLRNRPVALAFTTPPPPATPAAAPEKKATPVKKAAPVPPLSSIWPRNSDKRQAPAPENPPPDSEEDEQDVEDDVWIVERTETVVSISSESDHDLNLSPVSDVSDVDKLENVSSGEEDFNQCATCCAKKKTVSVSTQSRGPLKRSVNVQVDFVGQQLTGSCDVVIPARRRRRKPRNKSSIHSNTSSVSSCSSDDDTPPNSPAYQTSSVSPYQTRPFANTFSDPTTSRPTAQSFLASVTDKQPASCTDPLYGNLPPVCNTNQSSSNLTLNSRYNPFSSAANKFPDHSLRNQTPVGNTGHPTAGINASDIDPNKSFQASQSLSSLNSSLAPSAGYKSSGPFGPQNAIRLTTINSGTMMGVLSKPAPTRGILKMSRPADAQSTTAPSESATASNDFQPSKLMSPGAFQGGDAAKQTPYNSQNVKNQQMPVLQQQPYRNQSNPSHQQSFQSGSVQRQPFGGNANNQNQSGSGGQSFQGGNMQRQPFGGNTNNQNQSGIGGMSFQGGNMQRQPFGGNANNQNQSGNSGMSFQGGNMQRQPFVGNANNQNQSGMGGAPFQSYSAFAPQHINSTNFGNRFSSSGNVPTMVPPPSPVSMPSYNQQKFQRPSEGLGISTGSTVTNSDLRQPYFNSPGIGQQNNLYDRERY